MQKKAIFLYTEIVHSRVPTSVYSIRIDSRVRKMIDEIGGAFPEEIRALIEDTVRKRRKELLLARAQARLDTGRTDMSAAYSIREDRDVR